ncbi:ABC transporter substrate-binding protein [Nocardia sp. NPDC005366]|uniref:ABC transporter substrate-binding protein n=1 Tax=Nocardia sp. NPDC005366 TaxID=3156878 RepID=UPI0033A534A6
MLSNRTLVVLVAATALLVAGCGGRSGTSDERSSTATVSSEFGDLGAVCGGGKHTRASAKGVTADTIRIGVFSDLGFTKNPEFIDAAKVFAAWCNDHGGIGGRRIDVAVRDTNLTEVRQRMLEACREDFALVGGGAGLDALGVKDRLNCLLPSFPAQVAQARSVGADLEISASPTSLAHHDIYTGFRHWLVKEAYPDSIGKVGIVTADSPVSKVLGAKGKESFEAQGAAVVYDDLYPIAGMSNWTPFAQAIKEKGVRGLIFNGEPRQLAKLEESLTSIGYRLDWIDATNNNYSPSFLHDAGTSLGFQNNVADLGGVAPFEKADTVPAVEQVRAMFAEYSPDTELTFPQLRAISAWLLFAKSAASCGDDLTRRCVYNAASSEKSWTAGGLQAPINLSDRDAPSGCFNVEQATTEGWKPADFTPDTGLYRCDVTPYRYRADYGAPMTLADVGKSMTDLE